MLKEYIEPEMEVMTISCQNELLFNSTVRDTPEEDDCSMY